MAMCGKPSFMPGQDRKNAAAPSAPVWRNGGMRTWNCPRQSPFIKARDDPYCDPCPAISRASYICISNETGKGEEVQEHIQPCLCRPDRTGHLQQGETPWGQERLLRRMANLRKRKDCGSPCTRFERAARGFPCARKRNSIKEETLMNVRVW